MTLLVIHAICFVSTLCSADVVPLATGFPLGVSKAAAANLLVTGEQTTCSLDTVSEVESNGEAPVALPPKITLQQIKDRLLADEPIKAMVERFERTGGKFRLADAPPTGAGYEPMSATILIDVKRIPNVDHCVIAALYELVRAEHSKEHRDLDDKALQGKGDRSEYATEVERLSYQLMREHSDLAKHAIDHSGWPAVADIFGQQLLQGGDLDSFEKYLKLAKTPQGAEKSHFESLSLRYDSFAAMRSLLLKLQLLVPALDPAAP